MTDLVANLPIDMNSLINSTTVPDLFSSGTVTSNTATTFSLHSDTTGENFTLTGTFSYTAGSDFPSSGTVTGAEYGYFDGFNDVTIFTVSNASIAVTDLMAYVDASDTVGLFSQIFAGNDQITGSPGDGDYLLGFGGNDTIVGGDGGDRLNGGAGADTLQGGLGDDIYEVDASDTVIENSFEGVDWISTATSYTLGAYLENLSLAGTGSVNGTGNSYDNQIVGNSGNNVLSGLDGNDSISGNGGDDHIHGGNGDDFLSAGTGNDYVWGDDGADNIFGNTGVDRLYGGAGDDTYHVFNATNYVYENAGEGVDTVISSVDYALRANVENLTLASPGFTTVTGRGNDLDNTITGDFGANKLYGVDGKDTLNGSNGDDYLYGGNGNDTLMGGDGYFDGTDRMYGGTGDDTFYMNDTNDLIYENVGEGTDTVLSYFDYGLRANVENLTLLNNAVVGRGNDLGNAIVGTDLDNKLYGYDGDDTLSGAGGADTLVGGNGSDTLTGGAGRDVMIGGAGNDIFTFADGDFSGAARATADRITDFTSGQDKIDLSAVDANGAPGDSDAFTFIGTAAFSSTAGELRYERIGINTYVSGDTNGDGIADFMIALDGLHTMVGGDFGL